MREIKIPKGNGEFRRICVQSKLDELRLKKWKKTLEDIQAQICGPWVHGFMPGRSPVTNALAHVGREWTLSMDLKDFFDSVTRERLARFIPNDALKEVGEGGVLYKGAARQGLSTSPAASNIGAAAFDKVVVEWLSCQDTEIVYTRYADDLAFSWNGERGLAERIKRAVATIAEAHGFAVNGKKTRLQSAKAGRRVICGVSVGQNDIRPTRETRRKLRAAEHWWAKTWMVEAASARLLGKPIPSKDCLAWKKLQGLREWCSLKPPRGFVSAR